jgi:uncharacterized protein YjcR
VDKHDPAYEDAFKDWKSGMKYKKIAEKYGVTLSAVKSWATRDWKVRKVATEKKKSCNQKGRSARSKAQLGNQHAVGHGAPLRNQNNLKHGLYAGVYWDVLSDDEKAMLENMDFSDEEEQLQQQIAMLSVREHRLMIDLNRMRRIGQDGKSNNMGMMLYTVSRGEFNHEQSDSTGRVWKVPTEDEKKNGHSVHLNTTMVSVTETIVRFEAELTRVQKQKAKCIEQLNEIRVAKKPDGQASDGDHSDTKEQGVVFYIPDNGRDKK